MNKSQGAFRTISEVSEWLDTPAHVLRFWESKFTQIKPVKRAGGRRYYRPEDMALLGGIKTLLHDQGMTIKGVQKLLRDQGNRHVMALGPAAMPDGPPADNGSDAAADINDAAAPAARPRSESPTAPASARGLRQTDPTPMGPAFLRNLTQADRRILQQRSGRIAPLVARLVEIRNRLARA